MSHSVSKTWSYTINGKTYKFEWKGGKWVEVGSPKPQPAPEPDPDPEPQAPSQGGVSANAFELKVVELLNEFRVANGKAKVGVNQDLFDAAEKHSNDMAVNDFFSHDGSKGKILATARR